MISSTTLPAPSAAMPATVEGPSTAETQGSGTGTGAADFLTLLGAEKAAGKKLAKAKAVPLAANANKTPADPANGKTALATVTSAEAAKAALAVKTALKTAGEIKADGETGKNQALTALPAAILEALAASARGKDASKDVQTAQTAAAAGPELALDEPGKAKIKPQRTNMRRDGEPAAKSETALRSPEASADAARAAKADPQHPGATPVAPKPAETPAAAQVTTTPSTDPQPQSLPSEPQVTDTRIPLATREAAQAGFSAPVLAMRVTTKDGTTKSIEIRLDPAELGQVDVKLETGHDGKLKAVVSADNADAFELLKKDGGALEAALREAGVDLEEGALTFALNDSGADQSNQREAAYGGAEARRHAAAGELAASASIETTSWRNGVIDISV